jgi:hypothetical protein
LARKGKNDRKGNLADESLALLNSREGVGLAARYFQNERADFNESEVRFFIIN